MTDHDPSDFDDEALLRYSRQLMLPQFDAAGQAALARGRVLVVGLGGLGSPVAMYLAAAGVGELLLVDPDTVELSNLQRQIVHRTASIGEPKVASAQATLSALNPLPRLEAHQTAIGEDNVDDLVGRVDVVVDCSDNFGTRSLVNAATVRRRKPLVSGAAIRFEGQLAVFRNDRSEEPCYDCLYGSAGGDGDGTCTTNGVIAPLLGVIGSLQALETLKLLAELGADSAGKMLLYDALALEFTSMRFRKDPNCQTCGAAHAG